MTDTLTYLRAYKDQDLFTLPICKSVSDLFLVQYKWQKDPFIPLHYLNPICIERQINYLWQGKGRGVYKKNLKNIYCTGSLDVKHMSSAVWVFFPQFFFSYGHTTHPYTNIIWVSVSYSWPTKQLQHKRLQHEHSDKAVLKAHLGCGSGEWECKAHFCI